MFIFGVFQTDYLISGCDKVMLLFFNSENIAVFLKEINHMFNQMFH